MPEDAIARWAQGHGLPALSVDGNDVEAVHGAAVHAVEQIRATGTPRFLELITYRQRGHFEPDDQAYVDPAELQAWVSRDPIRMQRERLIAQDLIRAPDLSAMELRCRERIEAALSFAQTSPWPTPGSLLEYVYA